MGHHDRELVAVAVPTAAGGVRRPSDRRSEGLARAGSGRQPDADAQGWLGPRPEPRPRLWGCAIGGVADPAGSSPERWGRGVREASAWGRQTHAPARGSCVVSGLQWAR